MRKTSDFDSNREKVLDIIYQGNSTRRIASFSGKQIDEWVQVLRGIISNQRDEETETCPECGKPAPRKELLEKGCTSCGWISPRIKQKTEDRKQKTEKTTA